MKVPEAFAAFIGEVEGAAGARWIDGLPALVEELLTAWELRVDGPTLHGSVAVVVPVRRRDDQPAALKVSWVDAQTRPEARALSWWAGRGAVAVLDAAPEQGALLLERLQGDRSLLDVGQEAAVASAGSVLKRLHVAPPTPPGGLVTASARAQRWANELPARWNQLGAGGDESGGNALLEQVVDTCDSLARSPLPPVLLHGDFHYANVLARPAGSAAAGGTDGERWVAIDPKPLVGDGEFDLLPLLRNRWSDLAATSDPQRACRRRLDHLVEVTGADPGRARAWALVRTVDDALWGMAHGQPTFTAIAWAIADALR